jgi:hypothetical protein
MVRQDQIAAQGLPEDGNIGRPQAWLGTACYVERGHRRLRSVALMVHEAFPRVKIEYLSS